MAILLPQIDSTIPDGITNLNAFRRWARSDSFPEHGRFAFFNGKIWMDLSTESAFSHNQVTGAINSKLTAIVQEFDLGLYFPDGMLVSNSETELSTIPDGVFVSHSSFRRRLVRRKRGDHDDFTEIVGSPDMVLEVVSVSSVEKDTGDMMDLYWAAGVREYWLVDARREDTRFEILRSGAESFASSRRQSGGWLKSAVFDRGFRLTRTVNRSGDPVFTLESR